MPLALQALSAARAHQLMVRADGLPWIEVAELQSLLCSALEMAPRAGTKTSLCDGVS